MAAIAFQGPTSCAALRSMDSKASRISSPTASPTSISRAPSSWSRARDSLATSATSSGSSRHGPRRSSIAVEGRRSRRRGRRPDRAPAGRGGRGAHLPQLHPGRRSAGDRRRLPGRHQPGVRRQQHAHRDGLARRLHRRGAALERPRPGFPAPRRRVGGERRARRPLGGDRCARRQVAGGVPAQGQRPAKPLTLRTIARYGWQGSSIFARENLGSGLGPRSLADRALPGSAAVPPAGSCGGSRGCCAVPVADQTDAIGPCARALEHQQQSSVGCDVEVLVAGGPTSYSPRCTSRARPTLSSGVAVSGTAKISSPRR